MRNSADGLVNSYRFYDDDITIWSQCKNIRSFKTEVYVRYYSSISELRAGIRRFMDYYNNERLHSALGYKRPMDVHMNQVRIAA